MLKFLVLALLAGVAHAQSFPSKPVKILVPYAAGTGPEILTRLVAERLSNAWSRPVVVEARPGASGFIAIEATKNAAPDGHDLLLAANGHMAINPVLYRKLPYDPEKDLAPVALINKSPHLITVAANGPYATVSALIAAAKANPGKISYGSAYIGSPGHLGAAELEYLTGTQMLHVPFKDQNQAFVSIQNGDLAWMPATFASAQPMVKAGRIKMLALVGPKRLAAAPDVPTIGEAGGPADLEIVAWLALFTRSGTPREVIQKINADVNRLIATPEMTERMLANGWVAESATPEGLAELIRTDMKKNAELVRRTGARAD